MHFYAISEENLLNNTKAMGLLTLCILITDSMKPENEMKIVDLWVDSIFKGRKNKKEAINLLVFPLSVF